LSNIVFSIVSPAIRTENWLKVYNSILPSNHKFEIIFAGPRKPEYKLPVNFRYIYTNVKPAQCWEILYQEARGQYIINIGDDFIYKTKSPLNYIYKELQQTSKKKILLGMRYKFRDIDQTMDQNFRINNNTTVSKLLPVCPPLKKDLWYKYGRFDSRFICTLMEADFFMRMVYDGYDVVISKVVISEEKFLEDNRKMSRDYMRIDRKLMMNLWTYKKNNIEFFSLKRNHPVKNFNQKNLYTKSAKPAGRWSNNFKIYNQFISSKFFYKINFYYYLRMLLYKIKQKLLSILK
jgi:hypothetical protein